jgi:Putative transposase, YhgA-like
VTRIWDQHLRDHPQARQLPAVIPLVVHHGCSRWTRPVQLLESAPLDRDRESATPVLSLVRCYLGEAPRRGKLTGSRKLAVAANVEGAARQQ